MRLADPQQPLRTQSLRLACFRENLRDEGPARLAATALRRPRAYLEAVLVMRFHAEAPAHVGVAKRKHHAGECLLAAGETFTRHTSCAGRCLSKACADRPPSGGAC